MSTSKEQSMLEMKVEVFIMGWAKYQEDNWKLYDDRMFGRETLVKSSADDWNRTLLQKSEVERTREVVMRYYERSEIYSKCC